ncbi:hypothetical protein K353_06554 [Kitasatospora sp. SolWspMP-SS2h]|nr:hypothetical protein K353_06554 [Kitasatospora sp. SolWspMP-SS2h]
MSAHPPECTGQLLRDLDTVLEHGAVVVFIESRSVPDLLSHAPAVSGSAFHRTRAVALARTAGSFPVFSAHHGAALTRPHAPGLCGKRPPCQGITAVPGARSDRCGPCALSSSTAP